jgi:hypothetical protein
VFSRPVEAVQHVSSASRRCGGGAGSWSRGGGRHGRGPLASRCEADPEQVPRAVTVSICGKKRRIRTHEQVTQEG